MANPNSHGDPRLQYGPSGHNYNTFDMHTGHLNTPVLHQVPNVPFNEHSNAIQPFPRGSLRIPSFPPRPGHTTYPPPFPPPPHPPPAHGVQALQAYPQLPPRFNYTTPPPFPFSSNNVIPPQAQQVRIPSSNLSVPLHQPNQFFGENVQSHISSKTSGDHLNTNFKKTQDESTKHGIGRQEGKEQIIAWLQKIGKDKFRQKSKQKEKSFEFKINDYLCSLQSMKELFAKMSSETENLESTLSTADKTSWTRDCSEFDDTKRKFESMENLLDDQVVSLVAKKLNKINHKRARIKRMRQVVREEHTKMQEMRQARDKQINEWQKQIEEEMKQEKLKKERKINMDHTLAEVTRKIQDANRLIETMSGVEKLRLIRRDAAEKRGDSDLGESRLNVAQKIEDMKRVVKGQLEVYKEEEQALRDAIKLEYEESNKKEKQMQHDREEAEKREDERNLSVILFSNFDEAVTSDPLYSYQEFYKQAQKSLPALIQIRQEWDNYITCSDSGSAIPSSWVLPSLPSSDAWASALVQE